MNIIKLECLQKRNLDYNSKEDKRFSNLESRECTRYSRE